MERGAWRRIAWDLFLGQRGPDSRVLRSMSGFLLPKPSGFSAPEQVLLKFRPVFSHIVPKAGAVSGLGTAENSGHGPGTPGDSAQVSIQRLPAGGIVGIRRGMSVTCSRTHDSL